MAIQNQVRLIACDMDGTLLRKGGEISPGNAAALREAAAAGIRLCVASGRGPFEIDGLMKSVNAPYDIIGLNGALVRTQGKEDMLRPLAQDELALCIDAAESAGITWLIYTASALRPSRAVDRIWFRPDSVVGRDEALAMTGEILKFIGVSYEGDAAALALAKAPLEAADLAVSTSDPTNFEVNAPGVNKGRALEGLAETLAIGRHEVMAIGDYDNDLAMLTWAGVSVAMGNALPHVAAVARHRTTRNDEDGVALAIRRLALMQS